jgi:hypothetical protein
VKNGDVGQNSTKIAVFSEKIAVKNGDAGRNSTKIGQISKKIAVKNGGVGRISEKKNRLQGARQPIDTKRSHRPADTYQRMATAKVEHHPNSGACSPTPAPTPKRLGQTLHIPPHLYSLRSKNIAIQ